MTTMMKRVLAVAIVVIFAEASMLGNLVFSGKGAYADAGSTDDKMATVVFDKAYKPAVGIGITPIKATPENIAKLEAAAVATEEVTEDFVSEETEDGWQESAEVYAEGNIVYVGDDYYIINPNIAPYDGGGYYNANLSGAWYDGASFAYDGRYRDASGLSFTYYPESVLPGGGLNIPGRHVGDEGYVCDENGYVCLAADNFLKGTVVSVPFGCGTGVVYDKGSGDGNIDVYVSW